MDLHYKQEVTVGLLVIVSIAVLFGGLTFLSGKSLFGTGKVTFASRFENISGLGVGDPIQISGVKVGRVAGIDLQDVNQVVVHMEVSGEVRPHVDARVLVRALDALGAMYVDYVPGRSPELLRDGQTISGSRELALVETAAAVAGQASDVLVGAGALLSERTATEIHETLDAVRRAMNVVAQIGSGPAVREATRALERLASVATRLDSTLASPDLARSLAQLDGRSGAGPHDAEDGVGYRDDRSAGERHHAVQRDGAAHHLAATAAGRHAGEAGEVFSSESVLEDGKMVGW